MTKLPLIKSTLPAAFRHQKSRCLPSLVRLCSLIYPIGILTPVQEIGRTKSSGSCLHAFTGTEAWYMTGCKKLKPTFFSASFCTRYSLNTTVRLSMLAGFSFFIPSKWCLYLETENSVLEQKIK